MDASAIQQILIDGIPLARFIGLQVDEVGPGMVRLHMPFTPNMQNHLGTAYAGGIFSLDDLVAETRATIAQQGKADLSLSIEVMDADGEVVARVQATYYLRRQSVTHQDAS